MANFIGSKYDSSLTIVEICKRIRAELKTEIKGNPLFKGAKFSVRKRDYNSLSISVMAMGFNPQNAERIQETIKEPHFGGRNLPRYSPNGTKFMDRVNEIANAYNYDKCDTQTDYFDVGFYLNVDIDFDLEQEQRESITANIEEEVKRYLQEVEDSLPLCPECGKKVAQPYNVEEKTGLCWECAYPLIKARDERKKKEYALKQKETEKLLEKLTYVFEIPGGDIFVDILLPKLNKNNTLDEYLEQLNNPKEIIKTKAMVRKVVVLTAEQYDIFSNHLLHNFDWLIGEYGTGTTAEGLSSDDFCQLSREEQEVWRENSFEATIKIVCDDRSPFFVNPDGSGYARYVGLPAPLVN